MKKITFIGIPDADYRTHIAPILPFIGGDFMVETMEDPEPEPAPPSRPIAQIVPPQPPPMGHSQPRPHVVHPPKAQPATARAVLVERFQSASQFTAQEAAGVLAASGYAPKGVWGHLDDAVKAGVVVKLGPGVWRIPDQPGQPQQQGRRPPPRTLEARASTPLPARILGWLREAGGTMQREDLRTKAGANGFAPSSINPAAADLRKAGKVTVNYADGTITLVQKDNHNGEPVQPRYA